MLEFLYQNAGNILVGSILILIVICNIKMLLKGKNECACGCKSCPKSGICNN